MGERRRLLYVLASGPEAPDRVYAPFLLATSAAAMGAEATIYLLGDGVTVLKAGEAEWMQSGSLPPLSLVIERAAEAGVRMELCEDSCLQRGLDRRDFIADAKIVGASTLNDRILEADGVLSL